MFEKNMRISYLVDVYDSLLDEHTKSIMRAYYEDDLSLSEIAQGENISRQGVRHIIKKCEEQLELFEKGLGLAEHYSKLEGAREELTIIARELSAMGGTELCDFAERILSSVRGLSERNS